MKAKKASEIAAKIQKYESIGCYTLKYKRIFFLKGQSGSVSSRDWHDFIFWYFRIVFIVVCSSLLSKFQIANQKNKNRKTNTSSIYTINEDNESGITLTMLNSTRKNVLCRTYT